MHKKPQNIVSEHLYKVRKKLVFDGGYFVWILIWTFKFLTHNWLTMAFFWYQNLFACCPSALTETTKKSVLTPLKIHQYRYMIFKIQTNCKSQKILWDLWKFSFGNVVSRNHVWMSCLYNFQYHSIEAFFSAKYLYKKSCYMETHLKVTLVCNYGAKKMAKNQEKYLIFFT